MYTDAEMKKHSTNKRLDVEKTMPCYANSSIADQDR